jgi:hypothetical protein
LNKIIVLQFKIVLWGRYFRDEAEQGNALKAAARAGALKLIYPAHLPDAV